MLSEILNRSDVPDDVKEKIKVHLVTEKQMDWILSNLPIMLFVTDKYGKILLFYGDKNETYMNPENFIGKIVYDIMPTNSASVIKKTISDASINGQARNEYSLIYSDKVIKYYDITTRMAISETQEQLFMHSITNITEQKNNRDSIRQMHHFTDMIIENIPHMIFLKDAKELKFVRINRAGEEILGYLNNDLLGKNDYDLFPKEQSDFFVKKDQEVLFENKIIDISEEPIHTHNGLRYLHTKKVAILDTDGKPEYLLGISEDITEHKLNKERLIESERRYRLQHENAITAIALHEIVLDECGNPIDYIFLDANPAFEKYTDLKISNIVGKRVTEVYPGIENTDLIRLYGKVVLEGNPMSFDYFFDITKKYYQICAYAIDERRFIVSFLDLTEKKQIEQSLLEKERLGAIGELAYGIAHDFNNSLQIILGNLDIVLLNKCLDQNIKECLFSSKRAAVDASSRIKQLQRFGKQKSENDFMLIES